MLALTALSILLAYLTYRHIVRPLGQLEGVARRVQETKNYAHRVNYESNDEIGRLAAAFDEMLGELDSARKRELFRAGRARSTQTTRRIAQCFTRGDLLPLGQRRLSTDLRQ
ncbi:MAG: HAMP domain-containing protein [Hyphomicrobiales bacterium]